MSVRLQVDLCMYFLSWCFSLSLIPYMMIFTPVEWKSIQESIPLLFLLKVSCSMHCRQEHVSIPSPMRRHIHSWIALSHHLWLLWWFGLCAMLQSGFLNATVCYGRLSCWLFCSPNVYCPLCCQLYLSLYGRHI